MKRPTNMLSEQAKFGFDYIFKKAVMANITTSSDDSCEIESIDNLEEINEDEFAVLTISSPTFRLLALFHFKNNTAIENYFVKNYNCNTETENKKTFRDAFQEVCNICCGVINRELHKDFYFLGMSTPYMLFSQCLPFISLLDSGFIKHYKITINQSLILYATLCICDYGIIDFSISTTEDKENTGELELF